MCRCYSPRFVYMGFVEALFSSSFKSLICFFHQQQPLTVSQANTPTRCVIRYLLVIYLILLVYLFLFFFLHRMSRWPSVLLHSSQPLQEVQPLALGPQSSQQQLFLVRRRNRPGTVHQRGERFYPGDFTGRCLCCVQLQRLPSM